MVVAVLLAVSGCAAETARPSSLSERDRVEAFARVYGLVRFFHPSDATTAVDWNRFAVYGVERVLTAADGPTLRRTLDELFTPLVVGLEIDGRRPSAAFRAADSVATEPFLVWQHEGFGPGENPGSGESRRARFGPGVEDPDRLFDEHEPYGSRAVLELTPDVHVAVPLTVPESVAGGGEDRGLDALRGTLAAMDSARLSPERAAVRLAAVVVAWNVFEHFYPYYRDVPVDWPGALEPALGAAIEADGSAGLEAVLNDLLRPWRDGHISLRVSSTGLADDRRGLLPFIVQGAEGRLFVTASVDSTVVVGDEIVAIMGVPAAHALQDAMAREHGTERHRTASAQSTGVRLGPMGERADIRLRRGDSIVDVAVDRIRAARDGSHLRTPWPYPSPAEIEPGIWYVDMLNTPIAAFDSVAAAIAGARGVIFDLRVYPAGTFPLISHLSDSTLTGPPHCVLRIVAPFQSERNGCETSRFQRSPRRPRLSGRAVFLSSASSISAAETLLMTVREHRLATIVGEPTAGANGGVDWITVPGGFGFYFTSSRLTRYDGSRFQLEGVRPDIEVWPTVEGLRAGRDEQLEAALEWIDNGGFNRPGLRGR